uniref:lysophospholipase n=1 Tax=Plectus sambesii TaxID=2011161 RepID=A0A914WFW7_9BILA
MFVISGLEHQERGSQRVVMLNEIARDEAMVKNHRRWSSTTAASGASMQTRRFILIGGQSRRPPTAASPGSFPSVFAQPPYEPDCVTHTFNDAFQISDGPNSSIDPMVLRDGAAALLQSISWLVANTLTIVGFGFLLFVSYHLYRKYIAGEDRSPLRQGRRISPIRESDEDRERSAEGDGEMEEQTSAKSPSRRRHHRRKDDAGGLWPGQKLIRRIVKGKDSSASTSNNSDEANEANDSPPSRIQRRRHSIGPSQLARAAIAAKDFIVHGHPRIRRQLSMINRSALPRPPTEFFEPSDLPEIPPNLQPEIFYVLHNLKMLELPLSWKLDPKEIEVTTYTKGQYVVKPGDPDDSIIVVIDGAGLSICITHDVNRKEYQVKKLLEGSSLFSLLSMLEVLAGSQSIFRSVSAKAMGPTKVAKYPLRSFRESYLNDPQAWMRPIQIVITRLLHVTMTTLHQYLGLSRELTKPRLEDSKRPQIAPERARNPSGLSAGHGRTAALPQRLRQRRLSSNDGGDSADMDLNARKLFADALGLEGPEGIAALQGKITVENYPENHVIVEHGSKDNEKLMMVITGSLKLMQDRVNDDDDDENDDGEQERCDAVVFAREIIGGLQILSGEPSFYTIKTHNASFVAEMTKEAFQELVEERPNVVLAVAHAVLRRLSPFLRGIDFALDWVLLDSGLAIYRQGDAADCLYVVLSGRLRSVVRQNDKKTVIEEFGRGDLVGMIEVLQKKPRSTTVLAVRYSQLAKVPDGLLNFIKLKYPQVGFRMVQLLGQYYASYHRRLTGGGSPSADAPTSHHDPMAHIKNLHTIAVMPASKSVPLVAFTCELYHALNVNLNVLRLSSGKVADHLDPNVLDKNADFRLMHWLNVQEDNFPLVIYECDYEFTPWTRRCMRQADAILIVANGDTKTPKLDFLGDQLSFGQDGIRTNKELILLWKEGTEGPTGTFEWLKAGGWFSGHHHVRAPNRMYQWNPKDTPEQDVIEHYEQFVFPKKVDFYSDFSRLARILTGNAVGLVLGGGGARGAAHVGVIKAMREHGIPVDIVGGTSIGSMIGGLYCEAPDEPLVPRARVWFQMMSSLWRKVWDLTYAHTAMFTGAGFNKTLQLLFGDREIDDLWIPYFCISTNITTSEMRVHRSGPLWAYCRASMSLAGYLPPLCDPIDGHLLLDGGYVNNLPADVMRSLGARCVIAVDVGSAAENDLFNYGESLSGFWVLFRRLNPWAEPMRILGMEEIQSRLAFVSCVRQLEQVKKAPYCHYLRPPIELYKTLDFGKFNEIYELGYKYGTAVFDELVKSNENIKQVMNPDKLRAVNKMLRREPSRMADYDRSLTSSFTDLAAAMSKVPANQGIYPDDIVDMSYDEMTEEEDECTDFESDVDGDNYGSETDAEEIGRLRTPRKGSDLTPEEDPDEDPNDDTSSI